MSIVRRCEGVLQVFQEKGEVRRRDIVRKPVGLDLVFRRHASDAATHVEDYHVSGLKLRLEGVASRVWLVGDNSLRHHRFWDLGQLFLPVSAEELQSIVTHGAIEVMRPGRSAEHNLAISKNGTPRITEATRQRVLASSFVVPHLTPCNTPRLSMLTPQAVAPPAITMLSPRTPLNPFRR